MSVFEFDDWLRAHFTYRPESAEVLRTVERMILDYDSQGYIEGDCDDASIFAAFVLLACDYRPRFVAIRYSNPDEFEHVFVEVDAPQFAVVDPTVHPGTPYHAIERMVLYP